MQTVKARGSLFLSYQRFDCLYKQSLLRTWFAQVKTWFAQVKIKAFSPTRYARAYALIECLRANVIHVVLKSHELSVVSKYFH